MTRDHWRWGDSLDVELFVSWDGADLGGSVSSVGDVPKTVLVCRHSVNLRPSSNVVSARPGARREEVPSRSGYLTDMPSGCDAGSR